MSQRALARVANAAADEMIDLAKKNGQKLTREQIMHEYHNDPNMRSIQAQEAAIALGRQRLARQALKEGRARPAPRPLQMPGSRDAMPTREDAMVAQLNRKLNESGKVRDAAKLLAERRRSRGR